MASGPSLGRKRPRRAAIAQGATAPQQYATALHKVQVFLNHFPCKFRNSGRTATGPANEIYWRHFNSLYQMCRSPGGPITKALDFVIACGNAQTARVTLKTAFKMAPDKSRQTVACEAGLS